MYLQDAKPGFSSRTSAKGTQWLEIRALSADCCCTAVYSLGWHSLIRILMKLVIIARISGMKNRKYLILAIVRVRVFTVKQEQVKVLYCLQFLKWKQFCLTLGNRICYITYYREEEGQKEELYQWDDWFLQVVIFQH